MTHDISAEEKAFIDELLAQGYGVVILRTRRGEMFDAFVTTEPALVGRVSERWCN